MENHKQFMLSSRNEHNKLTIFITMLLIRNSGQANEY